MLFPGAMVRKVHATAETEVDTSSDGGYQADEGGCTVKTLKAVARHREDRRTAASVLAKAETLAN